MPEPKRILALSGGGVRGIVEVAFLEAIERVYRDRFGPQTRLCDVFDLIGGTSTGALIATALTLGHPMSRIADFYLTRASDFFGKPKWYRFGRKPIFDCAALEAEIRADVGSMTLGDPSLKTYLAIITKRLDTGSPWIVNNIPTAPYFNDPPDGAFVGNRHYELALLLRAATAAPTYFSPQVIEIAKGEPPGIFVDGGLTPYNDPSLALLMLARISRYGLVWPTGPENLSVLSLGTGLFRQRFDSGARLRRNPLWQAYAALRGMMADAEQHSLTMMEWLGKSHMPSPINSEIGTLGDETLFAEPLCAYQRLDLPLETQVLSALGIEVPQTDIVALRSMENPQIILPIYELTKRYVATIDLDAILV